MSNRYWPSERLVLEVGPEAWQIEQENGGGVVTRNDASSSEHVRLVRASDCQTLYQFDAAVEHKYILKVSSDGGIALLDETNGAYAYGPALAATDPTGCPT